MNSLVEMRNNQVVVDSKSVAENFGKSHRNVNRDIENLIQKDVLKIGHMFYETETPDSYGRMQKSYYMNRDGFSLLVMGFTGKKAIEWKLKYIQAFNEMEEKLKNPMGLPDFSNPAEMARAWADEFERRRQAEALNEANRPKVEFANAVAGSDGTISMADLAKLLKQNGVRTGRDRLYNWMREHGYLMKQGVSRNTPTQRAMEAGWFKVRENVIISPYGGTIIKKTTLVTGKGQAYFIKKLCHQ